MGKIRSTDRHQVNALNRQRESIVPIDSLSNRLDDSTFTVCLTGTAWLVLSSDGGLTAAATFPDWCFLSLHLPNHITRSGSFGGCCWYNKIVVVSSPLIGFSSPPYICIGKRHVYMARRLFRLEEIDTSRRFPTMKWFHSLKEKETRSLSSIAPRTNPPRFLDFDNCYRYTFWWISSWNSDWQELRGFHIKR